MDEGRGGLLSAGGILAIIVGVFELIFGGLMAALPQLISMPFELSSFPGLGDMFNMTAIISAITSHLLIVGIVLAVLGIIAIVGGISAIRRGSFGLALAGAICSLPSGTFGVLAIIFVSLARREFGTEY
jgi:hypothetical protein